LLNWHRPPFFQNDAEMSCLEFRLAADEDRDAQGLADADPVIG
jgi:hypothetical protein